VVGGFGVELGSLEEWWYALICEKVIVLPSFGEKCM
jgi:hypothetical protein